MVFEDAHWIDPTSRELLDLSVDRVRHLPVLLAITFRPEFQPPWGGLSYVMNLTLNRLGERDGEALVHKLAGVATLTDEIVAEIVERTDGVPLFVEELTKAVLENAGQSDRVTAVLGAASHGARSVPATLHAALMARLDRLGPAVKETAQIGAVLGREFSYELIEPVAQRPERELQAALRQLTDAGLLFCRGTAPYASYLFKHSLVQDAAYGTLLRARRREMHARVAVVLAQHFADLVERRPEVLASFDRRRQNRARRRSMAEGGAACRGAIGLPRSDCPSGAGSWPLAFVAGESQPGRMRNRPTTGIGGLCGHDPGACAAYMGAHAEWPLGYPEKALASAAASLALAERLAHPFSLGLALTLCSVLHLNRCEPERALSLIGAAEVLAAEQRFSLILEPGILRGVALLRQGAVDEATARIREGIANWRRLGRTVFLPDSLAFLAEGLIRHGDRMAALAALREGLEIARSTGEHGWHAELHRLAGTVLLAEISSTRARLTFSRRSASRKPNKQIAGIARRPRSCPAVGRARLAQRSPRPRGPGL